MFEKSGATGTQSGMPPRRTVKSRSRDVMLSFSWSSQPQAVDVIVHRSPIVVVILVSIIVDLPIVVPILVSIIVDNDRDNDRDNDPFDYDHDNDRDNDLNPEPAP
jgi:hypothetical protein